MIICFARFNLSAAGSWWIYFLLALILIFFSYFVYRYTLPRVSKSSRFILTAIRSSILLLVLLLIFEPFLQIVSDNAKTKSVYVLIDNSNSIAVKDSSNRKNQIENLSNKLSSIQNLNVIFFSFGNKIDSLPANDKNITLNNSQTDFEKVSTFLAKRQAEVKTAVIISDGIITSGIDPIYQLEKLPYPILTVGIGDTTTLKDVKISGIAHNQFVYSGKETKIEATINNTGLGNQTTQIYLYEENKIIGSQTFPLGGSGMNKIIFPYTPNSDGEKKLRFVISPVSGEQNINNNSSSFFIDVLSTKIKVGLIAGSPSPDVSAISNALESDKNIQLFKNIQVTKDKNWEDHKLLNLDSLKALFFVDFPSKNTSQKMIDQILKVIERGVPFFISLSNEIDFSKLTYFEKYLPVYINEVSDQSNLVQAVLNSQQYSANFTQLNNSSFIWNNLPPINQISTDVNLKPEGRQIVSTKLRDLVLKNPLIAIRSVANQRSFLLNGWNYWRWSLQSAEKNSDFFKNFINEIVKWLNLSSDKKQFIVRTNKKNFSLDESVEFTAEVYDKAFNPVDTSQISISIQRGEKNYQLNLNNDGNGTYSASFSPEIDGDYIFNGITNIGGEKLDFKNGRFNISNIPAEKINTQMQIDYLKRIAGSTGGKYFSIDQYELLKEKLLEVNRKVDPKIEHKSEYELWNNYNILVLVICLFTLEWFLRKRFGMI